MDNLNDLKNELNLEVRKILTLIDIIYGETKTYPNYIDDCGDEEFLKQQIDLMKIANDKLKKVFK